MGGGGGEVKPVLLGPQLITCTPGTGPGTGCLVSFDECVSMNENAHKKTIKSLWGKGSLLSKKLQKRDASLVAQRSRIRLQCSRDGRHLIRGRLHTPQSSRAAPIALRAMSSPSRRPRSAALAGEATARGGAWTSWRGGPTRRN